ncbi:cysteine synthase A [Halioxenophilus sp. WMMB6]|uniref:cysteine synthase A n=1 Tax=Halioxenophilus sp. WMMB6 TaxID=3073815 RepID=UPI00295E742F|nr:cysteine synthase A [Halioxenophilus sp. WMMB6]
MAKIYQRISDCIGNTPIVRINKLAPPGVNLYVKVESFNPMGSVKDRLALGVIEAAEASGELKPGQTIVEATSGNTGIGLAMLCAERGYPLVVTMAENFSVERRKLMRFLGAKVVLTPAAEKGSGMVAKAEELAKKHGWWQSKQFENPANADIHRRTTAREILAAFEGQSLDYWVSGFGTGGTLNGVASVLKAESPATRVVVCEPDNSAMLASGIAQPRNADGSQGQSHPLFRPHLMQGWSPDFISPLTEEVTEQHLVDEFEPVAGDDALTYAKRLAREEGIFVGITSGATFAAALAVARRAKPGSNILCMLPDTGERYLSTPLFDEINVDMDTEEILISQSTERFRFDNSGGSAAPLVDQPVPEAVLAEFQAIINDRDQPLVLFALEWCEFCWSVRKLFKHFNIEYRSVDLDSVAYQQGMRGSQLREALRQHTGWNTLPQIFLGGEFLGGCTDLFDGVNDASLFDKLEAHGFSPERAAQVDPYSMLPGWLHPR